MTFVSPERTTIELVEEEPKYLPRTRLSEAQAMRIHETVGDKVSVEFPSPINGQRYVFRPTGYVGIFPVDDTVVRIEPKVSISNLFGMLEYAYNLKSFRLLEGLVDVDTVAGLYENLAAILAKRVLDRVRKGLYRGYVDEVEQLPFVRGRMIPYPTALTIAKGGYKATCEFEDHTPDLIDNRILFWTLLHISRADLKREEVRLLVKKAALTLSDIVRPTEILPSDCLGRFYHRLNQDYEPMHGLCRFFLENQGPGISRGQRGFTPFLVYMPGLFESFVAEWLRTNAPRFAVEPRYVVSLNPSGSIEIRIDIVLRDPIASSVLAVVDTKYKRAKEPSTQDLFQVVGYAETLQTHTAILVYPSIEIRQEPIRTGQIVVYPISFDLAADLESSGRRFLANLHGALTS